jgi:hypothetical protein
MSSLDPDYARHAGAVASIERLTQYVNGISIGAATHRADVIVLLQLCKAFDYALGDIVCAFDQLDADVSGIKSEHEPKDI